MRLHLRIFSFLVLIAVLISVGFISAGSLENTNIPETTMHSLEDIYTLITGDTPPTPSLSPSASPASSMHTVSDVYIALANLIQATDLATSSVTYLGVNKDQAQPEALATTTKEFIPTSDPGAITGFTLTDIYNLITGNVRVTTTAHQTFSPATTPDSTMYTLDEIYDELSTLIDPANINEGATYLGVEGTYVNTPEFCGGDGSEGDPYQICSASTLQNIRNNLSAHYILTDNVDVSITETWNEDPDNPGTYFGFEPIGFSTDIHTDPPTDPFIGTFDGNGYTIDGLFINRPDGKFVALFGATDGATINNLSVTNASVTGQFNVATLVGYNGNSTIDQSNVSGTVNGVVYVGGLVARNQDSNIIKSYSTVDIVGAGRVGGLIGYNAFSLVTDSYSSGDVSGIADWSNGGGLIGQNGNTSSVLNSYSTGAVSGAGILGGLIGEDTGATVTSSYWDIDTSGQAVSAGGVGTTTVAMKQQTTYTDWDFTSVWSINEGVNYPALQ